MTAPSRRASPRSRPACRETRRMHLLAQFLFRGDRIHLPVGALSGGERLRATLACVLYAEPAPQLLLLDEPTNNLDLVSVGQLESALNAYQGAFRGGQPRRTVPRRDRGGAPATAIGGSIWRRRSPPCLLSTRVTAATTSLAGCNGSAARGISPTADAFAGSARSARGSSGALPVPADSPGAASARCVGSARCCCSPPTRPPDSCSGAVGSPSGPSDRRAFSARRPPGSPAGHPASPAGAVAATAEQGPAAERPPGPSARLAAPLVQADRASGPPSATRRRLRLRSGRLPHRPRPGSPAHPILRARSRCWRLPLPQPRPAAWPHPSDRPARTNVPPFAEPEIVVPLVAVVLIVAWRAPSSSPRAALTAEAIGPCDVHPRGGRCGRTDQLRQPGHDVGVRLREGSQAVGLDE